MKKTLFLTQKDFVKLDLQNLNKQNIILIDYKVKRDDFESIEKIIYNTKFERLNYFLIVYLDEQLKKIISYYKIKNTF